MEERITTAGIWTDNGKILIGKRIKKGVTGSLWEFPGGKNRWGETPAETLKREYLEELHLQIEVGDFITMHDFTNAGVLYHLYAFEVKAPVPESLQSDFHTEFKWVSPESLYDFEMVQSDACCIPEIISRLFSRAS